MKKLSLVIFISAVLATGCNLVSSRQNGASNGNSATGETKNAKDYPNMPASLN